MPFRLFLLAATALVTAALPAAAVPFAGLVVDPGGSRLVGFDSATPGTLTTTLNVTGLRAGESLNAIDTRPSTDELYAVGSRQVGIPSSLYTINTTTGAATFVAAISNPISASDIAFNPVPDAIRIVNSDDENVRVNPVTGVAVVDTSLAYAASDMNAGANPFVGAIAYTNQDQDPATGTQLFGVDLARGLLVLIDPPNSGTLTTVGSLGIQPASFGGFDIVAPTAAFFSTGILPGVTGFYSIDLGTGAATLIGTNTAFIVDIAQAQIGNPVQPIPEPASMTVLGFGLVGLLAARRRWIG